MAMDAQAYTDARSAQRQFDEEQMLREINKARVAFSAAGSARTHSQSHRATPPPDAANAAANATIASGNWGCGAFGACHPRLFQTADFL